MVEIPARETEGLAPDEYEVIGEKVTHRLAQRSGSYVIITLVRAVVKIRRDQTLSCPPAPGGVLERSYADVSFIAGMLIDKFLYHLPLYRPHQCLKQAGITVSRGWLTQVVHRSAQLLGPSMRRSWS
jgi:transposase